MILFHGATLLPGGDDWAPRPGQDLLVADGRIAAAPPRAAEVVDARDLLLLPGFVNAHTHSNEALRRGRAPRARLDDWLAAQYPADAPPPDAAAIRRAVLLTAAEAVRGGAVAVTDHFRHLPAGIGAVAVAAQAWGESRVPARLAVMLRDLPSPGAPAPGDTRAALDLAEGVLADPPPGAAIGLGPSAPQRCSDALLEGLGALARRHGAFVHLHVLETAADAARCRARFGTDAALALARLGLAGPHVEYAHGVHLTDAELDEMAAQGTRLVHNPVANLRLGSGIAPLARALARGVPCGIGTDGAGSNDAQDMLEAAKLALLLPRAGRPEAEWPAPEAVLRAATGGAALRPGAPADLIAFDLRAPAFAGAAPDELCARLLLAARARDLRHVVARGAFLLREGVLIPPALREAAA